MVEGNIQVNGFNSKDYWNERYSLGGNSGAGSYGRLARYKANIINGVVSENSISRVIEYGSGILE